MGTNVFTTKPPHVWYQTWDDTIPRAVLYSWPDYTYYKVHHL